MSKQASTKLPIELAEKIAILYLLNNPPKTYFKTNKARALFAQYLGEYITEFKYSNQNDIGKTTSARDEALDEYEFQIDDEDFSNLNNRPYSDEDLSYEDLSDEDLGFPVVSSPYGDSEDSDDYASDDDNITYKGMTP